MAIGGSILGGITGGATIAITIRAIDKFSRVFDKASFGVKALGGAMKIGAAAAVAVGVALVAAGTASVKAAADFEQTTVAFTTMLGSAEEADKFLRELAEFAKRTPFTIQGVELAARKLMAVGFAADDVIPVLTDVGNIAAGLGLGEEGLSRLILNLGQVQAQGKLTGRELRDFAVAGIPMLEELSKELGVTTAEVSKMVSAGEIDTAIVLRAFKNMASEGGRFANLMEKQALTVAGRFSNLKDSISLLARELGAILLPIVGDLVTIFVDDVMPAIKPLIPVIGDFLKRALESIVPILPRLMKMLTKIVMVFMKLFDALMPLLEPLMDIGFVLIDAILDAIVPLIPAITSLAIALVPLLKVLVPIVEFLGQLLAFVTQLGGGVLSAIFGGIGRVTGAIPQFQKGGLVTSTGPALLHKGEYVTPANQVGAGITIIIQDNNIYGTDPNEMAEAFAEKVDTMIRV